MADKPTLKISRDLFRWARESAGLPVEIAAKRIGINVERLQEWEGKEALPTARQLEKAADTYKRPVATFFLPAPPAEPPLPVDFRAAPDAKHDLSPITRLAIRRARWLNNVYVHLKEESRAATPEIPNSRRSRADSLAEVIREWLADTFRAVQGKQPSHALRLWRDALENAGILVFQFPMPVDEAHAFSLSGDAPAIVLNSHDAYSRRIFSTVHELAHLVLRQPGLCNPSEASPPQHAGDLELLCNEAAGLALVPQSSLLNHEAIAGFKKTGEILPALATLARRFAVSRQVILKRLVDLKLVGTRDFHRTMDELQLEYEETQRLKKKTKVMVPPSTKAVGQLGKKFIADVLAAHDRGAISDSDVSEYLGVRLQHLDKIQDLVGAE